MKNTIKNIISGLLVLTIFIAVGGVHAATLDFAPDSTTVAPDGTFDVQVNVEAGTQQVAGTDIYVTYDSAYLELQPVTNGDYFPKVDSSTDTNRLYISGIIETAGDYKTGSGTVATIKFKALQEGTTTLTFDCDTSQTDTSKIVQNDVDATNVLDCAALQSHTVTITASADASATSTELPQSGVYEDMVKYAVWGGILVALGAGLRLLLGIL